MKLNNNLILTPFYKKILIGSVFVSTLLFANNNAVTIEQPQEQSLQQTDNDNLQKNKLDYISRKNTGMNNYESRAYEENNLINLDTQKKDDGQFNYTEVVYEHLKAYQRMPRNFNNTQQTNAVQASYNFFNVNNQVEQQQQTLLAQQKQAKQQKEEAPDIRYLQGYCSIKNETTIERVAGYASLNCDFMNYGHGILAVALTPDFFSQALIATPLYVQLDSKKDRMLVQQGVVLNGVRTSINVASEVNDYLIQKIVASSGIAFGTTATKYAQDYLDEKKQSRVKQDGGNLYYDRNGNLIQGQVTTNTEEPEKSDYITGAAVEFVSSLINVVGNAYLDRLTYTFKVKKDSVMFADLQVDFNKNGIRGLNFAPNNMIMTNEPRFEVNVGGWTNTNNRVQRGQNTELNVPLDGVNQYKNQGIQSQPFTERQIQTAPNGSVGQQIIIQSPNNTQPVGQPYNNNGR